MQKTFQHSFRVLSVAVLGLSLMKCLGINDKTDESEDLAPKIAVSDTTKHTVLDTTPIQLGGRPELVKLPGDYKTAFTYYNTRNRAGKTQVGDAYANDKSLKSVAKKDMDNGSIVVMEIYNALMDLNAIPPVPLVKPDGIYQKDNLAAIAVMEKRNNWGKTYPEKERAGEWGFAMYNPDGTPKMTTLDCASCHRPLASDQFLFSYASLLKASK